MATHKWSDIKNNMFTEHRARVDEMVRKELVKMNKSFWFHRFGATSWQLNIGPLCIDRHDSKLAVLWGTFFTIFDGIFWSKKKSECCSTLEKPKVLLPLKAKIPSVEDIHIHKLDQIISDRWKYVPGVGTVCRETNEVFIPETPIPLTENELEYGRQLAKKFGLNRLDVPYYPALEKQKVSAEDSKVIPDASSIISESQYAYFYPSSPIWETWREHFKLSEQEAKDHWCKRRS